MFNSSANAFGVLANEDGMSADPDITVTGEDADEVEIENFGFVALNGDTKVKLFPDSFPDSSIPISSASLFTIANKRGVFAAAGPSTFILGTTESLRKTFTAAPAGAAHVNYNATVSIPLPTPVSHIAFNSSEKYLILGASSGGVAVYSTDGLLSGTKTSLFEVGTNGLALRELKPNPNPESSEFAAVMTQNGELRMLNLEMKGFVPGSQGEVLKTGISTIAWSQRGKQLICGLMDGACSQITPDGLERAAIPKPPGLVDYYVSHVTWLENNLFIVIFTPIPSNPQEPNNDSICYVFSRSSNSQGFRFQKLPDPTPPFGMTSRQAYFFCAEIKHWSPRLQDALILANPSSADIGLVTRFSAALPNIPEGTFTVTTIANDSRRAALPLQEQSMTDTSPIGVALDLSSRDRVARPIAGEDPEETGPLPILMVLNNESVVSAWHIVYSDAVRNNESYPQLTVVTEQASASQPAQNTLPPAVSAFAAPASPFTALSGSNKAFGASTTSGSAPALGQPTFGSSAFGQSPARPAFGQAAFGKPAFGQASFGQSGWGTAPAAKAPVSSTFGSSGNSSTNEGSTFGSNSGFGKFASAGGFASMAASAAAGSGPVWAKGIGSNTTSTSPFGGLGSTGFGGLGSTSDNKSAFGSLSGTGSGGSFGSSLDSFKIGSTFQADTSSSISAPSDNKDSLFGGFGSSLGGALGNDSTPAAPDADMDAEGPLIATPVDKEEDMESTHSEPSTPTTSSTGVRGSGGIFGSSKPVSAFPSTASPPKADVTPQAAFPPSPKLAKAISPTDAPLPPDPVPRTGKEEFPDIPLPPVADEKKDKSKVGTSAAKEAPQSVSGLGDSSSSGLSSTGFGQSTIAPAFKATGTFGSTVKPPTSGLFSKSPSPAPSEKSGVTSSSSITPTPGIFSKSASDLTPRSVFGKTTQPLPPLGGNDGGLFGAPAVSKKKSSKNGGSVLDTPPDSLSDGIFAGFGKNKPVNSDDEDDEDEKPSKALPSQAKSTLSKKSELGKKPDGSRGKPISANPMHRFGPGKSRQPLKPSPLSRRQHDEDEEEKANEEEYEDEEGEDEDEEDEEIDTVEEAKKEELKPKSAFGDKRSQIKPSTPSPQFGAQKPAALPKAATPPISHRNVTPTPPQRTLTPVPQVSRAPTPAPPPVPQEYEDEKIRKTLQSDIPVEPNPAPPVFALNDKIVEASPHDGFEAIYDKAYESCNVMVNSIGMLSRNLDAYVSAHKQSPDLHKHSQHRPVDQLKEVDEWRLSELEFVAAIIEQAAQVIKDVAKQGEGLDEMIADLTKGILRLQSKASELERLERVIEDPKGAAVAQSHYLPPEQALQQREIRNKLATVQYELEEAEKAVSMLKANVVARDRGKSGGRVKPPTVEAVRNTILKLTGMVETKNSDVEYLGEKLKQLKAKQALGGISFNEESTFLRTTLVVGTPARGKGKDKVEDETTITEKTQMATTIRRSKKEFHPDEMEIEETREEIIARRATGRKLRKALKIVGTRVTNVV